MRLTKEHICDFLDHTDYGYAYPLDKLMLEYFTRSHMKNVKTITKFQMSFFFSKKVFRCHSCSPATDKQTKSESKLSQNILLLVALFSSCISSSLQIEKHKIVRIMILQYSIKKNPETRIMFYSLSYVRVFN